MPITNGVIDAVDVKLTKLVIELERKLMYASEMSTEDRAFIHTTIEAVHDIRESIPALARERRGAVNTP